MLICNRTNKIHDNEGMNEIHSMLCRTPFLFSQTRPMIKIRVDSDNYPRKDRQLHHLIIYDSDLFFKVP